MAGQGIPQVPKNRTPRKGWWIDTDQAGEGLFASCPLCMHPLTTPYHKVLRVDDETFTRWMQIDKHGKLHDLRAVFLPILVGIGVFVLIAILFGNRGFYPLEMNTWLAVPLVSGLMIGAAALAGRSTWRHNRRVNDERVSMRTDILRPFSVAVNDVTTPFDCRTKHEFILVPRGIMDEAAFNDFTD